MFKICDVTLLTRKHDLSLLPKGKLLINTINAHSYNVAQKDDIFASALRCGDVLIPDGESIVVFSRLLWGKKMQRIAGYDLFEYEMGRLNSSDCESKRVMFMGSSEKVLRLIKEKCAVMWPKLEIVTYSPPYKNSFSDEDNKLIIEKINNSNPDLLWIGMTAPKQEKWAYEHWNELSIKCHCGTIGAVFDFCAGTVKRAPRLWQRCGCEWLYRLIKEPKRMWRRYIIGNTLFVHNILKEKYKRNK